MKRVKIVHRTYYNFSAPVELGTHYLRLRPREGHQLRIEHSSLTLTPEATISWQSDIEGNSIAAAKFQTPTAQLAIESEIVVQQYNENPFDFLLEEYAVQFPFTYQEHEWPVLSAYVGGAGEDEKSKIAEWSFSVWNGTESIQSISLLLRLAERIRSDIQYSVREEPGVQLPAKTLSQRSGSCRDFAALFIAAARHFGLAARFVSGYLVAGPSDFDYGATHAWAEVYLPGAGWTGIDSTIGIVTGSYHIPVAVSRLADSVPPVAGSFVGFARATMDVGVWVAVV